MTEPRKGQAPGQISRAEFSQRCQASFRDPAFAPEKEAIKRIEQIAWLATKDERKSPVMRKAGPGYADPDHDLSVDWLAAHDAIAAVQATQADAASRYRVLMIIGSARNDGRCPGEISNSFRRMTEELQGQGMAVDTLDLRLRIRPQDPPVQGLRVHDRDLPVQQEACNVVPAVAHAVKEQRTGTLAAAQPQVRRPRPK